MQIIFTPSLTEDHAHHLFKWTDQVFPIEGESLTWSEIEWHLTASINGCLPIAHIGYAEFEVLISQYDRHRVVGVADVVVRPEHQGKGIPAKLFEVLHESNHAKNLSELFILFCPLRLESYYKKHGYEKFNGSYTFMQGNEQSQSDDFILMYYGKDLSTARSIKLACEPW